LEKLKIIDEQALEIQRIYVLQELHGKKIGQLLIDEVLKIASYMLSHLTRRLGRKS
jgi:flagellar motor switch protein FliG